MPLPPRSYEKDYNSQVDLQIEMNMNLRAISRSSYQILDLLSDIGGMQAVIMSIFAAFLAIMNYKHFDTFMASRLFKIKKPACDEDEFMSYFERSDFFKASKFNNIRNYLRDLLPSKLLCCHKSR